MHHGPALPLPAAIAFLALAALLLAGCAAYRPGAPDAAPVRSVFVEIVENETYLPQVNALLTRQIRETLAARGGTTLAASPRRAAYILRVTLTDLEQTPRAALPADTTRAASYDLRLGAALALVNAEGETVRESAVEAATVAYLNPALPDARHQALPRLTTDLARRIADAVLHPWDD
ncbi:MAG: hypothetical protein JJU00_10265 [Opitutales bacterium]|nr:hypothetical protein [Opitutales bacterium]